MSHSHLFLFFREQRAETAQGFYLKTPFLLYKPHPVHSEPRSPVQQQGEVSYFSALKEIEAVNSAAESARRIHIEVGT